MINNEFYLCACSSSVSGGIYRLSFGPNGLEERGFTCMPMSNFIILSKDRKTMYSTGCDSSGGFVSVLKSLPSGDFEEVGRKSSDGASSCYLCLDKKGEHLYCANYLRGSFTEFALAADGSIARRVRTVRHMGHGQHPTRQNEPHVHCVTPTPDGKYIAVVDLGTDSVLFYPLGNDGIIDFAAKTHLMEPGDGPRHIIFMPDGVTAYLINELSNTVVHFRYYDGSLTEIGRYSTIPNDIFVETKAAAIKMSPDGKRLFASNRGFEKDIFHGSVACYDILSDGSLRRYAVVSSGGNSPRDIAFLQGGEYFVAANEFSDQFCFYKYSMTSGELTRLPEFDVGKYSRPLFICNIYT